MLSRLLRRGFVAILGFFMIGGYPYAKAGEPKSNPPDPLLTGMALPDPPRQAQPWTPREGDVPEPLVSATTKLFQHGLADPRGCKYCEIELICHREGYIPRYEPLVTRGWVLPEPSEGQRFAIAWNGLICPAVRIGPKADLRKDILALITEDEAKRAEFKKKCPGATFNRRDLEVEDERDALSHKFLSPLTACLLLRVGHRDLAASLWNMWKIGTEYDDAKQADPEEGDPEEADPDETDPEQAGPGPYPMLAKTWITSLLGQALAAHSRGDDEMALSLAQKLGTIAPVVEPETPEVGKMVRLPPIAAALFADQQRRSELRKSGKLPPPWIKWQTDDSDRWRAVKRSLAEYVKHFPEKPKRIAELIDLLEYSDWDMSHVFYAALAAEGNDAIEPLLDCYVNDQRLSRSVMHGGIKTVSEMAMRAVLEILKNSFVSKRDANGTEANHIESRKALAEEIREYAKKFKDMPLPERWYVSLADDNALAHEWLTAADNITLPCNYNGCRDSCFRPMTQAWPKPGQGPRLQGETLRDKRQPSVAELMARRVEQLSAGEAGANDWPRTPLERACEMAMSLARWAPESSVPILRRQMQRCREAIASRPLKFGESHQDASYIARFTIARVQAGDRAALDEYAKWLRGTTPEAIQSNLMEMLEPLWRFPQEKSIQETADWLFGDPTSPWNPLGRMEWPQSNWDDSSMIQSPLITVPAFRQLLLRLLADKAVTGTVKADGDGIDISANGQLPWLSGYGTRSPFDSTDPRWPPYGTEVPFRTCDVVACDLDDFVGMPECGPCWPEADRNRAVAACADILKRYGSCYKLPEDGSWNFGREFVLPLLDHPATTEDVREGRAIFSLAGEGEIRRVRSACLPQEVRWTTVKKRWRWVDGFQQCGKVWQAEEVGNGGKWQRYFGFVGLVGIHRVPAEEIEFCTPNCWKRLNESLDVGFFWQGTEHTKAYVKFVPPAVDSPMGVCLCLKNRKGTDQTLPRFFDAGTTRSVSDGITVCVRMSYTPEDDLGAWFHLTPELLKAASKIAWTDLKPRRADPLPLAATEGKILGPAETTELVSFDMAQWFPVEKPGTYRLRVEFNAPGKSFEPVELFVPVLRK